MWKKISDKEKAKYEALSKKDKVRYEKDMEGYTPPPEDEIEEKGKRGRVKKERTGPKRALSSYMYFCQDSRDSVKAENPDMNGKEVTSELGRRWKELSDDQKTPFEAKAAADKLRYESEKESSSPKENGKKATKAKEVEAPKGKAKAKEVEAPKGKANAKEVEAPKGKAKAKEVEAPKGKAKAKEVEAPKGKAKEVEAPKAKAKAEAPKAKAEAPKAKGKEVEAKSLPVKKSPGFDVFCEESRDDIQTENPDWGSRKVVAELQKRWQELTADDREAYEADAADASEDQESEVEELEEN